MKKKICFIMPNVFPVPAVKGGATETIVNNIIDENEKKQELDITCISIYDEKAAIKSKSYKYTNFIFIKEDRENIADLTFTSFDETFKDYLDNIYEEIKNISFDFIIIEGGDITGYEYLINKLPMQTFLVHIHGNVLGDNRINSKIYKYFIAISEYTKKMILLDGNIKESQIKLLYNAIKTDDFKKSISSEEKRELRKKYGIEDKDNVIAFFGRVIPEKGVKELIQGFKQIKNINNSKLLIVGNSHYGENVKNEFEIELEKMYESIKDKVKFTGYIENTDLYKIHSIADIAVLPSMFEELFGLVFVEAMSSGLPIITTNSGGIPEVVNEKCAIILERDENLPKNIARNIDYLIENPSIREKMSIEGKKRYNLFDISVYYDNLIKLINSLDKS